MHTLHKGTPMARHRAAMTRARRLAGFDYRNTATYFVTVCTYNRAHLFGEIRNGEMGLNDNGRIATDCVKHIANHFPGTSIDTFVVMPNHVHALLHIGDAPPGNGLTPTRPGQTLMDIGDFESRDGRGMARHAPTTTTTNDDTTKSLRQPIHPTTASMINGSPPSFGKPQSRSLSTIVGAFKSAVTKRINESRESAGTVWQRNFHEHIVRSQEEYDRIRAYILHNPSKWTTDRNNRS